MNATKFDKKTQIKLILKDLNPSESIALIESIGKELRRKNSIRINSNNSFKNLDLDRPDLYTLKNN